MLLGWLVCLLCWGLSGFICLSYFCFIVLLCEFALLWYYCAFVLSWLLCGSCWLVGLYLYCFNSVVLNVFVIVGVGFDSFDCFILVWIVWCGFVLILMLYTFGGLGYLVNCCCIRMICLVVGVWYLCFLHLVVCLFWIV